MIKPIKIKAIKDWEPGTPQPVNTTILLWQDYYQLGSYLCDSVFHCERFDEFKMRIFIKDSETGEEIEFDKKKTVGDMNIKPLSILILRKSGKSIEHPAPKPKVTPQPKEEPKPIEEHEDNSNQEVEEKSQNDNEIEAKIDGFKDKQNEDNQANIENHEEPEKNNQIDEDSNESNNEDQIEQQNEKENSENEIPEATANEKLEENQIEHHSEQIEQVSDNVDEEPKENDSEQDEEHHSEPLEKVTEHVDEEPIENNSEQDEEQHSEPLEKVTEHNDEEPIENNSEQDEEQHSEPLEKVTEHNDEEPIENNSEHDEEIKGKVVEPPLEEQSYSGEVPLEPVKNDTDEALSGSAQSNSIELKETSTFQDFQGSISPSVSNDSFEMERPKKQQQEDSILAGLSSTPSIERPSSLVFRKRDEFETGSLLRMKPSCTRLAVDKTNNFTVIYKELDDVESYEIKGDLEKWVSMTSPTILPLYGFIESDSMHPQVVLILPYESNGSLAKLIELDNKGHADAKWDYTQKCIFIYGIAHAMRELHANNIIHASLTPQNILISDSFEPLITDINMSQHISANMTYSQSMSTINLAYTAPEITLSCDAESPSIDVYSFGMVLYFIYMKMHPFSNMNTKDIITKLDNGNRPAIPKFMKCQITDLIEECWNQEPENRPTFDDILEKISSPNFFESQQYRFDKSRFDKYKAKLDGVTDLSETSSNTNDNQNVESKITKAEVILEMAKEGDAEAQYQYACILRDGVETAENPALAARYFKLSADQNYGKAMIEYAICLKDGYGVDKNEEAAYELLDNASNKSNNADAQYLLAIWYEKSNPHKYALAYKYYKMACDNNHPDAPAAIGSLLQKKKLGITSSMKEILDLYQKASDAASNEGMYYMATLYHYGYPPYLAKNLKQAARLYMLASQEPSEVQEQAAFSLSVLYQETNDYKQAFDKSEYYMNQGMFVGYLRCAELYEDGIGVRRNTIKAKQMKDVASLRKFARDQCRIGCLYSRGTGCQKNKTKAFELTKLAAENDDIPAMVNLCYNYLYGNGVSKDPNEALKWANKASDRGSAKAKQALALIYRKKFKNKKLEMRFLKEAATLGLPSAMTELAIHYVHRKNYPFAEKWFKAAAENNDPSGCYHYGYELFYGNNIAQDVETGFKYLEDAAFMGCLDAIKETISIMEHGINGIKKDITKLKKLQDLKNECMK